jgi:hypothetical protein
MPVIDRQPTDSECLLARMQSTAAPLSVVVHITAKMGPRTKRKELGRTCMQLESGEQLTSPTRFSPIRFQRRLQLPRLQQPKPH